jgi:hypothetical protein
MHKIAYAMAALIAMVSTPVMAQTIGIDTFQLGQSAADIEKARNDRSAALRTEIERARESGALQGPIDPYFSTGIGLTTIAGGYDFTIGNMHVFATCKERGMRIFAITQDREFKGVTVADVMPALKQKYGAHGRTVRLAVRPGMTYIDQWVLWNGVPAGMTGEDVEGWGRVDRTKAGGVLLPPGMSAHVQSSGPRVDVRLARYSPEIAADTAACVASAQAAARERAVGAIKF